MRKERPAVPSCTPWWDEWTRTFRKRRTVLPRTPTVVSCYSVLPSSSTYVYYDTLHNYNKFVHWPRLFCIQLRRTGAVLVWGWHETWASIGWIFMRDIYTASKWINHLLWVLRKTICIMPGRIAHIAEAFPQVLSLILNHQLCRSMEQLFKSRQFDYLLMLNVMSHSFEMYVRSKYFLPTFFD